MRIIDDLADEGFAPRLTTRRSFSQWWRWMRHKTP
jgi:hypothetical protein